MNECPFRKIRQTEHRARGFTLIEVLLVLVIMVIVAAVAWPALQKPLARRRVQAAADTVRTKLFHTRIGAMQSSRVYEFQYMAGSGSFRFGPQDEASAAAKSDNTSKPAANGGPSGDDGDCQRAETGALPDGVRFLVDNTPEPGAPADSASQNSPSGGNGGDGWSDPIFFYPDGTASDAKFIVASDHGCEIHIKLRGITGSVAAGDTNQNVE